MNELLRATKSLLRRHRVFPKKRFGQNFLVNSSVLKRMVDYANVNEDDLVLEVGAGLGFLTETLARTCKRVFAVEIDPRLVRILRERLGGLENVELIEGDILKVPIPKFNKVVSTPPYSISSQLLFWLLGKKFECAVLTFQKEFAERLNAPIGSKEYCRLTVMSYYKAEVELLELVPKEFFYPKPDVDSIITRLKPKVHPPFEVKDEKTFFDLVRVLFTQKNKKVRNAVIPFLRKTGLNRKEALEVANNIICHEKRVRELAPEDFGALANELS